jgi:hypothetical protein
MNADRLPPGQRAVLQQLFAAATPLPVATFDGRTVQALIRKGFVESGGVSAAITDAGRWALRHLPNPRRRRKRRTRTARTS